MKKKIFLVGLGLVLLLLGTYIFLSKLIFKASPAIENQKQITDRLEQKMSEFEVVADEFSFTPSEISVKTGDKVRITFKNNGSSPHNLVLEGLNLATQLVPQEGREVLEFEAREVGDFVFYCANGNHRQFGMEGRLKVE